MSTKDYQSDKREHADDKRYGGNEPEHLFRLFRNLTCRHKECVAAEKDEEVVDKSVPRSVAIVRSNDVGNRRQQCENA